MFSNVTAYVICHCKALIALFYFFPFEKCGKLKTYRKYLHGWKYFQNVQKCLVGESPLGEGEGTDGWAKSEQAEPGVQRRHRCSALCSSYSVPKNCALRRFMLVGQFSLMESW